MIIRMIRFILGYVRFYGQGAYGERFLNLLFQNGISVWDVKKTGSELKGKIRVSQYKKIRPFARKTGMRVRVEKRCGAPFLLRKILKRRGLVVGIALFLAVMTLLSNFIWSVEVSGNEKIDTKEILGIAYELGVKPSNFKGGLNYRKIEREILLRVPELSWVGISTIGSRIVLNVKERVMAPDMVRDDEPCNVVAANDGFIIRIEPYSGRALKKVGDAVVKGELLISGAYEDKSGVSFLKHAMGTVIAQTQHDLTAEVPLLYTQRTYVGEIEQRRSLSILGITIPLHLRGTVPRQADVTETVSQVEVFGVKLPALFTVWEVRRYEEKQIELTEEEARHILEEQIIEMEVEELKDADVISSTRDFHKTDAGYVLTVHYSCQENIAKQVRIELAPAG